MNVCPSIRQKKDCLQSLSQNNNNTKEENKMDTKNNRTTINISKEVFTIKLLISPKKTLSQKRQE